MDDFLPFVQTKSIDMRKTAEELEFLIDQKLNNLADIPDNEDLIVKYLIHRYEEGKIYTWVGPVLLAINPRSPDSDLYDEIHRDNFAEVLNIPQKQSTIAPHVFAVAATARYRLIQGLGKAHQVIVISGDSGSGKTFSASKILRFLAATNEEVFPSEKACDEVSSSTLSKIERACLVVSAFSTASTERNKHSSRHGQLVQLEYLNGSIRGAVVNSFLLEQSRVTSGSNNFLIFGQMLAGLSESELETLNLSRNTFYKIARDSLNAGGFEGTVEAMNSLGLGEEQRRDILKVIALLIHLGNIEFEEQVTGGCDIDINKKDSTDALESACNLMGFPTSNLVRLLTMNLIRPRSRLQRHSTYHTAIPTNEACKSRLHSIIKYLYYRLFQWLLNRLNEILSCGEESPRLLGILDIFGFEFFSENSIEQLSINYANERMQNHFMQKYLEASRSELESEGLSTLPPPPTSCLYEQRLAAIERNLFPALNDACLVARIDRRTSLDQLALSAKQEYERFVHSRGVKFAISHYSCTVEYRTADILRKNTDKVPAELRSSFSLCQNKFIILILDYDEARDEADQGDRPRIDKKKNTALAKLKHSMDTLIKELEKYDLHYIRCVKPIDLVNDSGMIKEFREQLACSGVLDALPLARCTLPIRLRYDEFSKRYSKRTKIDHKTEDPMNTCKMILRRVLKKEESPSLVHCGKRLIFLAEAVLYKLEIMRDEFRSQCASRIQACWFNYKLKRLSRIHESSNQNIDLEDMGPEEVPRLDRKRKGFRFSRREDCDVLSSNFIVDLKNREFFHRNRILSRRRLADIPVRFHTRLTCLMESHRLPQSELPGGLEDCL